MRPWLRRIGWFGWALIVFLVLAMHGIGQHSMFTVPLVFAPLQLWLGGLLVCVMLGLVSHARRLIAASVITLVLCAGPLWSWRTHQPPLPGDAWSNPGTLRVLTCNRGQSNGHRLMDFIAQQQPEVIALQESNEPDSYVPTAPEYAVYPHRSRVSEFQLLSKLPSVNAQLVVLSHPMSDGTMMSWFKAARFELQMPTRTVALYVVHLISPRHVLRLYTHATIADPNEAWKERRFFEEQEALLGELMPRIEAEKLPVIVCGDFNIPPAGPLYRRMVRKMQDSHTLAGQGFGYSFPGDVWNPLTLGDHWLRIDYVLCDHAWEVLRCTTEPESQSQHSAVCSMLRLR